MINTKKGNARTANLDPCKVPPPPPRVINIFEAYTRKILIDMKNLIAEEKEIKIVVKNLVVEHLTVVNCSLHVIVRVQRKSFLKVATLLYILGSL